MPQAKIEVQVSKNSLMAEIKLVNQKGAEQPAKIRSGTSTLAEAGSQNLRTRSSVGPEVPISPSSVLS